MKEYSQRIVYKNEDIGKYLTARSEEGWEVQHIQFGAGGDLLSNAWYVILVREVPKKEAEG